MTRMGGGPAYDPAVADGTRGAGGTAELLDRAREIDWYHSLELAPGFVTEGEFDLRPYLDRHGLPERMDGLRALDVGTFNGFWALEMERRGAEVVAIDLEDPFQIDWPALRPRSHPTSPIGEGFRIAQKLLGSEVQRVETSIYDANPGLLGTFDFAFCGSLLIHLRDQFLAIERINSLLRDGGTLVSAEEYSRVLNLIPFATARYRAHRPTAPVFWEPSAKAWRLMLEAGGFSEVREVSRFRMTSGHGYSVHVVVHHSKRAGAPPRDREAPGEVQSS
jgi:tRNA (mo5U34)-methyltransferase